MKKNILTAFALILTAVCSYNALGKSSVPAGSCYLNAIQLRTSQDVKLLNEYDPEWKQYTDMGVVYYKFQINRGTACTIWITGGKTAELSFSVDSYDMYVDTDDFVLASFDYEQRDNGATQIAYLRSEDWDEEDPWTSTFYIAVSGEIGDTCKLFFEYGIHSFTQIGEESNPERITMTESLQTTSAKSLIEGEYYFASTLEQGRKYQIYTINGTSAAPMSLNVEGGEYDFEPDPAHSNDVNNSSGFFYPKETAEFAFNVFCLADPYTTQKFKLKYRAIPARSPKNHPYVQMTAAGGYEVQVTPGRVVSDLNYYDNVVDEGLGRIRLLAGERWIFQTSGAVTNIAIRLYDTDGNILKETTAPYAAGGYDIRSSLQAPADGNYYFGVYIPDLQYWEEDYLHSPVTVNAYRADDFDPPPGDEFEPVDDTVDGATPIIAYAGEVGMDPTEITAADGLHALNQEDWYDWFAFPCRQGVSYALKASFVDEAEAIQHLTLAAAVYREVDGVLKKYKDVRGNITPNEADLGTTPFIFTADRNGMFYLRINVAEGCGLDYPAYRLHAMAYSDQGLGLLQVNTKGYDSTWFFKGEDGVYPNGAIVAVPTGNVARVKFTPHTDEGFATPALISTNVVVGIDAGAEVTSVTGIYNDTYDPGDDTRKKGTVIYPRNYAKEAKRTLWTEDKADWFKFTAKDGYYYNIAIVDTTGETLEGQVGDAMFKLIGPDLVATDSELVSVSKRVFAPGENYIGVTHSNDPGFDTSYSLVFTAANVGAVKLATTSRVVSESVDYVEFTVQRTASDGRVRVHYATQSGELYDEKYPAKPGEDYYPEEGVVEWEDGDMSDKIVRIRLIPDLTPTYEGAFKKFWIKFWPMEEDCLLEDEYPATISGATEAYVKIKEGDAMNPGSVVVEMDGPPWVLAGEDFTCRVVRVGGSDGTIAVDVRTINGTAIAGTDYVHSSQLFVWADGETDAKDFVVHTAEATTSDKERKFSIKVTANGDGDYETPTIPVVKTPVWIVNDKVAMPFAEFSAEALEGDCVTVAAAGTWYIDSAGQLRSDLVAEDAKAQIKFTVDGPGLFFARPQLVGPGTLTCTLAGETLECNGDRLALAVPAGRQTVTIRAKDSDGTSYVLFDTEDGWPYKWLPFAEVEAESPARNFVVKADVTTNLTWSLPYGFDTEGVWYRVRIGSRAGKSEKIDNVLAVTQETSCAIPGSYALEDGKKYWWMLDYAWSPEEKPDLDTLEWIEGPSIWPFQTAVAGAPETFATGTDAFGMPIEDGETINLVQGVFAQVKLADAGGAADSLALVRGELPPGMKLKANVCKLKGTPTEPGDYEVLLQVTSGGKPATTKLVRICVEDLGLAAGSFVGVLKEDGSQLTNNYPRVGYLQFTAGADGTISAKAKIADKVEKFSASSFGEVAESRILKGICDDGSDVLVPTRMAVTLTNTRTVNNVIYTNTLEVVVGTDGEFDGAATFVWNAPDEKGVQKDIRYVCDLYRNNADLEVEEFDVASMESFAGYYTVSLVPEATSVFDGRPAGYGFLTVTVAEDGAVQFAGRLADGTVASGSAKARHLYEYDDVLEDTVDRCVIPLCFMANSNSLGGELRLRLAGDDEIPVVDSKSTFSWNKDGSASTYDGEGFSIVVQPVGGWYDTVLNLQRYYLEYALSVETEPLTSLPQDMLPAGYAFTPSTLPSDVAVDVLGNNLSVQAAKTVKEAGNDARYDLAASVNPWATTVNFVRATGVVSGKFKIWGDDGTAQKKSGYYMHYGVLLMNRETETLLDDNVWTAGFGLVGGSSWLSIPFCIRAYESHVETVDPEIPIED
jgi:hypothetical protein